MDSHRLARALFLPEPEEALFEPGEDRRMVLRRIEQAPLARLGMRALVIGEHDCGVVEQLAIPLALRKENPRPRSAEASLQDRRECWLRVPDEADLRRAQSCLLP